MNLDAQWIAGFTDGEGCFHIEFNKNETMTTGYAILPTFVVSQHARSEAVLYALKDYFKTGVVRQESKQNSKQSMRQYRVRNVRDLQTIIVPFFEKHSLKTTKKIDFLKFRYILCCIERKEHLTIEGVQKIYKIASTMNNASKVGRIPRKALDFTQSQSSPVPKTTSCFVEPN